jgi:hypothetical protein
MNQENSNIKLNNQVTNSLFDLSEKIILNIETNLFDTLGKMIEEKFISNTLNNLCKFHYNEIYKYIGTKTINETVNNFISIQKIFPHNLLCILKISFGITIEIIKNLNRTLYDFTSEEKFVRSIQNQLDIIKDIKFEYFENLIHAHTLDDFEDFKDFEDFTGTNNPNKKYF